MSLEYIELLSSYLPFDESFSCFDYEYNDFDVYEISQWSSHEDGLPLYNFLTDSTISFEDYKELIQEHMEIKNEREKTLDEDFLPNLLVGYNKSHCGCRIVISYDYSTGTFDTCYASLCYQGYRQKINGITFMEPVYFHPKDIKREYWESLLRLSEMFSDYENKKDTVLSFQEYVEKMIGKEKGK